MNYRTVLTSDRLPTITGKYHTSEGLLYYDPDDSEGFYETDEHFRFYPEVDIEYWLEKIIESK